MSLMRSGPVIVCPVSVFFFSHDSTVRRANSNEHMGTLTRKDSGESKGNRTRTGSTGSNSSGKKSDR